MAEVRSRGERELLIITQYYEPEPNFITADVARALSRRMRVTVVTAQPNYPLGRFYDGVRGWLPSRTVQHGVTVWRLPMVPDQSLSLWRRAWCYLSFTAAATAWSPFVARSPSTVLVYHTPFTTALAALWFKYLRRARLIYASADLWPESLVGAGVAGGRLVKALFRYRRMINRAADLIICSTRGTLNTYASEGIPERRLRHIPVWVDATPDEVGPLIEVEPDSPVIVYAGNLGPAQRVDTLIRAAAELEQQGTPVQVDIYGTGSAEPALRRLAAELATRTVSFHGRVAPERAFAVSAAASAQYVALEPSPLFAMTVPSKLAFCCAAGAPLLCGLQGEAAALADESGGAVAFDPEHAPDLVSAIRTLLARSVPERLQMRRSLRTYYSANFARRELVQRYVDCVLGDEAQPGQADRLKQEVPLLSRTRA